MSSSHIVCVGDELLSGDVSDAHGSYIARFLTGHGVPVARISLVSDNYQDILGVLASATARSQLVIVTGGLGPTSDDRTRDALGLLVGQELEFDEDLWQSIQKAVGRTLQGSNRQQACRPALFEPLPNSRGTAPGLIGEVDGCRVVALPGPPHELRGMLAAHGERIVESLGVSSQLGTTISCFGVPESRLEDGLQRLVGSADSPAGPIDDVEWHTRAEQLRIVLRIVGGDEPTHQQILDGLNEEFGPEHFAAGETTLAGVLVNELVEKAGRLAAAESCTGGMIGAAITDVPGSSEVFWGSLVTYANAAKHAVLGMTEESLDRHGAVSKEAVMEMARAVRRMSGAEFSIAVSGIAGPGGGSDEKPVGTVWIALETGEGVTTRQFGFSGDRGRVRRGALTEALLLVRRAVVIA